MIKQYIDSSMGLALYRARGGLRIAKPASSKAVTLSTLMTFPFSAWVCDPSCSIKTLNDECARICGGDSPNSLLHKTAHDFLKRQQADIAKAHDIDVMSKASLGIINFEFIRLDDFHIQSLNFKLPLYDSEYKIIGTVGCGLDMNDKNVASHLSLLTNMGWLSNIGSLLAGNDYYLSMREQECLKLTIRGKSAKQIGQILGISQRTVEEYINNIKAKFKVSSKSELIDKATDSFFV